VTAAQRGRIGSRGRAFAILIAITLVMMALSSNPAVRDVQRRIASLFAPVQGSLDAVAGTVASLGAAAADVDRLRSDNTVLQVANDRLAADNARLEEARRENQQLSAALGLRDAFGFRTVAAQVIAAESSPLRRVVTIGKGSDDGIKAGDVVVGDGGALVGRVIDAGPAAANVLLISDTSSTVIGRLPSAATGAVVGGLGRVVGMDRIDATEEVSVGDQVVTAGIALPDGIRSAYPKGLPIGRVVDVRRDPNAVVQTAWLLPAAPLDRLEYVLVITDYEGGFPSLEPSPEPQP
jgi:rod shape-determining protein MreC